VLTSALKPLVVICTKDRPDELRRCLTSLANEPADVLLVDAGTVDPDDASVRPSPAGHEVLVIRTPPQLTAQRNVGIEHAIANGYDVVLFMDDDVVVEPGYVNAALSVFARNPDVAGVGAVVTNEPPVHLVRVKAFFGLWSTRPGVVLPSGRNVVGHFDGGPWPRDVEWLSGCAMSYRLDRIGELRFDERLMAPWGDDVDFGFRVSRRRRLVVDGTARLAHYPSPVGRTRVGLQARSRVSVLHAWVLEHRADGLRPRAFWWSLTGELLLSLLLAPVRRGNAAFAGGLVRGAWDVVRRGSDRSRWLR